MRSICYRRQGSRSETLFLVLSKVHKVTPCFVYMIAHDIVHHSSDCDTNELDEASRSVRTPHELRLRHCSLRKVAIRKKRKEKVRNNFGPCVMRELRSQLEML